MDTAKSETTFAPYLLYLIAAVVLAGGTWAAVVPLEEAVPAAGIIRPLADVFAVSAPATGTVVAVHHNTGADVVAGDALLTLAGHDLPAAAHGDVPAASHRRLPAPVSRTLYWQRNLLAGDRVQAGERVTIVHGHGPAAMEAAISQQDLGRVRPGMPARLRDRRGGPTTRTSCPA